MRDRCISESDHFQFALICGDLAQLLDVIGDFVRLLSLRNGREGVGMPMLEWPTSCILLLEGIPICHIACKP